MKNVVKFLVLMLLIVPLNVASKELILENTILFGGSENDYVYQIKPLKDGGYIAAGSISSNDIQDLNNNGSTDALLIKYDATGKIEWKNNYGGTGFDSFNRAIETSNNEIIAVGVSLSDDIYDSNNVQHKGAVIVKYDKNGKIIWQRCRRKWY